MPGADNCTRHFFMMPSSSSYLLYTVADIRQIEQAALQQLPTGTLMQRAGQAAAHLAVELLSPDKKEAHVLVLAGPGNNGGDALEAATLLAQTNINVRVVIAMLQQSPRPSAEAQAALDKAHASPVHFVSPTELVALGNQNWDLIIDGLFGIGLQRALQKPFSTLIQSVRNQACPVLALDVPSGLDADTGTIMGGVADDCVMCATHTLTFLADKPGLYTGYGPDCAGRIMVDALGLDSGTFAPARMQLNHPALFEELLRPRQHNSHKGSFGDAMVIGGASSMAGAVVLAARAAAFTGAGRVLAGFLEQPPVYDALHPELMCRLAETLDFTKGVIALGPGLGCSEAGALLLKRTLHSSLPLILDADALNLLAAQSSLQELLSERVQPILLTPHPLEAARLLECSVTDIQQDRLKAARKLAQRYHAHVILKGAGSVIASPDGQIVINTTGNAGLATAGSGDVLTGICAGLLAQHPTQPGLVARAATWLHGAAADELVLQGQGPIGLTAGELIQPVRSVLNRLIADHKPHL